MWWIFVLGAAVVLFLCGFRIVRPTERGVVEFLGKYQKFSLPGFNWVVPFVQKLIKVNVTEQMVDAKKQSIITKDNLNAEVDAQVYFKVRADEVSVKNSLYAVDDCEWQIVNLARTTLRNIIGNLPFSEANSDRNKINTKLMEELKKEAYGWGIDIVRTELKEIDPPGDVQEAMNRVIKAENERIAAKDFATAKETEADGIRRSDIKVAEGKKQARILEAEGVARAIELENTAIRNHFKDEAVIFKKLDVAQRSLENNSKVLISRDGIDPIVVLGEDLGKFVPFSQKGKKLVKGE